MIPRWPVCCRGNRASAEKPHIQAEDYNIEAKVNPQSHKLTARAVVKFVALDDISIASFELHNALRVTRVTDAQGNVLTAERVSQDSTVRVALPNGMSKGQEATLTFDYEGNVTSADDSPVPGLRLAYVGDPITYLLYSGRWFPVTNYGIDRFTARMKITVPAGVHGGLQRRCLTVTPAAERAKPSERAPTARLRLATSATQPRLQTAAEKAAAKRSEAAAASRQIPPGISPQPGMKTFTFIWTKPSFPGTVVIGKFCRYPGERSGNDRACFLSPGQGRACTAVWRDGRQGAGLLRHLYGVPISSELKLVELPDDSVPTAWAPEMVGIAARNISAKVNYRLLANAVAHQWFGTIVSPATRNDWWIQDGGARYSESRYIEYASGPAGAQEAVKDMEVGALAYDSVPLGQIGTLDTFDPVFQSMASDKGGMIYHMLRWVMGDQKFDKSMRTLFQSYVGKPVGSKSCRR